jgi:transposase
MRTGKPCVLKTNHGRARLTFHAAVSADGPRVVVEEVKSMTGDAVIAFLTKLERLHPQSKAIHFICDNASYYRSCKVLKWLEQSRIKVHVLPPYSPNLNIAERLWTLFRQEVTLNRFHPTVAEFREACGSFFKSLSRRCTHLKSFFVAKFQVLPEIG